MKHFYSFDQSAHNLGHDNCKTDNPHLRFLLILMILISFTASADAQRTAPLWDWAVNAGGNDYNSGNGIACDEDGNTFVAGDFQGTITFGTISLTSAGSFDGFLVKYATNGQIEWAIQFGGPSMDYGYSVAVDQSGNAYLSGYFQGQITINGELITSSAFRDMMVAKVTPDGTIAWFRHAGGEFAEGFKIAVNDAGYAAVTGYYYGTLVFADSPLTISSNGDADLFIALYDTQGQLMWVNGGGGLYEDRGQGVSVDNEGNVICSGFFVGPATFGSNTLNSPDYVSHICLLKFDLSGNWTYAHSFGSSEGGESPFGGHTIDAEGNIVMGGIFYANSFTIGSDVLVNQSPGYFDIFFAKFDGNGGPLWARQAGGDGIMEYVRGVDVDAYGNCYFAGNFETTAVFGDTTLTVTGNTDAFVAAYRPDGSFIWAIQAGGPSTDMSIDVATDAFGNIYTTGYFYENISFGAIAFNAISQQDMFAARINQDINTASHELAAGSETIQLFPNPADETINLNTKEHIRELKIFNASGKIVLERHHLETKQLAIGLNQLVNGTYVMLIIDQNGLPTHRRIIVNH